MKAPIEQLARRLRRQPSEPARRGPSDAARVLEREFDAYRTAERIDLARQACIMALSLTTLFALLDVWAVPSALHQVWAIRLAMVVTIIVVMATTGRESFARRYEPIMMGLFLVLGFGVEAMVLVAGREEAARSVYFSGVLLVQMGLMTFSHLRSTAMTLCSLSLLAGYLGITLGPHEADNSGELPVVIANCAFFVAAWSVGWVSRGLRERHARDSFRRKRRLEQEIALKERARQVSEHLSNHDVLTGLPNRKHFERLLDAMVQRASAEGRLVAVLFADLDGFKPVNDRLGHQAGDQLLRSVAARLRGNLSRDDVVARLGGDEFVVAATLPPDELVVAGALALRLQTAIADPIELAQGRVRIGASIGVAVYPADGEGTAALIGAADADMYRVKRQHKARRTQARGTKAEPAPA